MLVVTTLSEPPGGGGAAAPRPRGGGLRPSQLASEYPCQLAASLAGAFALKWNVRVCVPASASTLSVLSSVQVMWTRPGTRMMAAAPYALHWLPAAMSLSGSHASAALRPAG